MPHLHTDSTNIAGIIGQIGLALRAATPSTDQREGPVNFYSLDEELLYAMRNTLVEFSCDMAEYPGHVRQHPARKIANVQRGLTAQQLQDEIALYLFETELTGN